MFYIFKKLISKQYVTVHKSFEHLYYVLNDNGVNYIKKFLNLNENVVPKMFDENLGAAKKPSPDSAASDKLNMDKAASFKEANLGAPSSTHDFRGGFRAPK